MQGESDILKNLIISKIKDGSYYQECLDGHLKKYTSIKGSIIMWAVVTFCLAASAGILLQNNAMDQFAVAYPFPVYFNKTDQYFLSIKGLPKENSGVNTSVIRYFLTKYIALREEYDPVAALQNINGEGNSIVESMSTKRIYKEYIDYNSPANPDSPIIRYRNDIKRTIKIRSIKWIGPTNLPASAVVYFTATENSKSSSKASNWKAEVGFSATDIENMGDDDLRYVQFVVTTYRASLDLTQS